MMNAREPDPYAPPRSGEEVSLPGKYGSGMDWVLRWVGAVSLGCGMVLSHFTGKEGSWAVDAMTVALCGALAIVFLLGGRPMHMGMALAAMVRMGSGAMNWSELVIDMDRRLIDSPLMTGRLVAMGLLVAYAVAAVCGVALFVRGRRREKKVV